MNNNTLKARQRTPITSISLFSGIGSFELAAEIVFGESYQTFQFVEINKDAQSVLRSHFPHIPIWSDIRTYQPPKPGELESPTIAVGGFPCLGTSNAGRRTGLAHEQSSLWWEMYRVVLKFKPDFVVVENPEGIIHRGLRTILGAFRMAGYQTEIEMLSAAEFGLPHRRNRIFIIAYSNNIGLQQRQGWRCWHEQIRDDIEATRNLINQRETKSKVLFSHDGIPSDLVGLPIRTKGRRTKINLVGRAIAIPQAVCVMIRVNFLRNL